MEPETNIAPVEPEPTEAEMVLLTSIKFDSMLQGAHPIVAYNVTEAVMRLLEHLGRPKLAEALVRIGIG
jgi:hypothetical protein